MKKFCMDCDGWNGGSGCKKCRECINKQYFQLAKSHQTEQAEASSLSGLLSGQREFKMMIETHTPKDPGNVCKECVLSHELMCLDRSYCEFPKTGKTWRKSA